MLVGLSKNQVLKDRFARMAQKAAEGIISLQSGAEQNQAYRNMAKVLYAKSLIGDGQYGQAQVWMNQTDDSGLEGYDKRDWLHIKMVTQTYHGEYEAAWQSLQDYYAHQEARGEDMDEVRAFNSPIEEDLVRLLEEEGKEVQDISPKVAETPADFAIKAYPNPFNPVTNIEYTVPVKGQVILVVYDLLGREVATLVNGQKQAGTYSASFDASGLATGVYMYRLQAGSKVLTGSITLIK